MAMDHIREGAILAAKCRLEVLMFAVILAKECRRVGGM